MQLQDGDEGALVALFDRYLGRLYRFCAALLRSPEEAEEVVGEVFLQAFRHARDFRGEGTFAGWLFRIARNICLERLRTGRRLQIISLEELREGELPSADGDRLLHLAVREAMAQLPPDYRLVLGMRDVEGLINPEAAAALGRSPAAAKSLHFRARQALRDKLSRIIHDQP